MIFTSAEGLAVIRLNRPRHRNRLEPADVAALHRILTQIEQDDSVRVVVLTATGTTFCAGYDLHSLSIGCRTDTAQEVMASLHDFEQVVDRLESCRVPTICGLNGPVYGGGVDLALACDLRIGVATTVLGVPAVQFGIHYFHGGLRRFVTRLGLGTAQRLLLLAESMTAQELFRVGFLSEVVPTVDALSMRVDTIVQTVTSFPVPGVVTGMKHALNRLARADFDRQETDAAWAASVRSPAVAREAAERLARPGRHRK